MKLAAELDAMRPNDFAVVVHHLVDVFRKSIRTARHPDHEVVEIDFRNSLKLRRHRKDSRHAAGARGKSEIRKFHVRSALRLVESGIEPEITETKFVHSRRAERLGVA